MDTDKFLITVVGVVGIVAIFAMVNDGGASQPTAEQEQAVRGDTGQADTAGGATDTAQRAVQTVKTHVSSERVRCGGDLDTATERELAVRGDAHCQDVFGRQASMIGFEVGTCQMVEDAAGRTSAKWTVTVRCAS